jgi:hypothetical protein
MMQTVWKWISGVESIHTAIYFMRIGRKLRMHWLLCLWTSSWQYYGLKNLLFDFLILPPSRNITHLGKMEPVQKYKTFWLTLSILLKTIIVPSQIGAGTGHRRRGAEEFREIKSQDHGVCRIRWSTVAEREVREVMASRTSAAPSIY